MIANSLVITMAADLRHEIQAKCQAVHQLASSWKPSNQMASKTILMEKNTRETWKNDENRKRSPISSTIFDIKKLWCNYNAVIKPALLYGASIWTSTSKENLNNIFRLQKRAVRIILDANLRSRSLSLFNTLNWLPFYQDAFVNRCTLIRKSTWIPEIYASTEFWCPLHKYTFQQTNLRRPIYNNSTEGGERSHSDQTG